MRIRPKFKVGDILEEYVTKGYSAPKGTIYHYMVMDVKYEKVINIKNGRFLYNKKSHTYKVKYGWVYTLKSFKSGQIITTSRYTIDVRACIKRIA